jgi:hypothetical protein
MKVHLLEQLRDFLLGHARVRHAMARIDPSRFVARTMVVDAVKSQIEGFVDTLDSACARKDAQAAFDLVLPHSDPVALELPLETYLAWVRKCLDRGLVGQPWWPGLKDALEQCRGVVVSGGIFDACPCAAVLALCEKLGPNARARTKRNRLTMLHGACLEVYKNLGCNTLLLSSSERLPVLKFE